MALAFALTGLGAARGARAQAEPVTPPTEPPPPVAVEPALPDAVSPPPDPAPGPSPEPPPAAARAEVPPPKPPEPERDRYDGPPLLFGGGKKVKVGAYGALGGAYTRFLGRDSGLVSLEGALLLDHRFSIGLVGYGFTRTPRGPYADDGSRQEFGAGYGGVAIRYSWLSRLPIYPTFGVVLGGGAVNLHRDVDDDDDDERWGDDDWDDDWDAGRFDPFLLVQPELAVQANATRWLRLGINVGYRFTGGVGRFGLEERDLNGVVAGGTIAFGWF